MKISRILQQCLLTFVLALTYVVAASAQERIDGIRIWPSPESTRVVFDMTTEPDYSYFTLENPHRLVVDFKHSNNAAALAALATNDKRILKVRKSKAKKGHTTRLVLELANKYQVKVFPLKPASPYSHRLVVDIYDRETLTETPTRPVDDKRDIIIAIVAGHGGEDPGSIGANGTYEKYVTLDVSKKLAALIEQQKGFKSVMIRSGDYYVNHDRKTQVARKNKADFLLSIHADAFTSPQPSGASVWVQSTRRANSELSKWMEQRQKNSELLGGVGGIIKETADDNLAITLADMQKEYSLASSIAMSEYVLRELKKVTKLHKKEPQHMSLAVLKSSDIPSILVELGFMSNPAEERKLKTSRHQEKLAKAIVNAVKDYFYENPPAGSLVASLGYKRHRVVRGESLSLLAQRYNVPMAEIKSLNKLRSNSLRIGQNLKIPQAN